MKTIQKILVGALIIAAPFLGSCGKDDPATCNYTVELEAEANALSNAYLAFSNDPSTANCQAYKVSLQNYLNASEDIKGCVNAAGQGVEFQQYLDSLQVFVDTLTC